MVVYDRTIGVMAVRSAQERIFDEGHLEILRVLASEASIAIENARLFHEEQTKSRQLTLLNSISRNAISTLNPEAMLVDIAELDHYRRMCAACREAGIIKRCSKRSATLSWTRRSARRARRWPWSTSC